MNKFLIPAFLLFGSAAFSQSNEKAAIVTPTSQDKVQITEIKSGTAQTKNITKVPISGSTDAVVPERQVKRRTPDNRVKPKTPPTPSSPIEKAVK